MNRSARQQTQPRQASRRRETESSFSSSGRPKPLFSCWSSSSSSWARPTRAEPPSRPPCSSPTYSTHPSNPWSGSRRPLPGSECPSPFPTAPASATSIARPRWPLRRRRSLPRRLSRRRRRPARRPSWRSPRPLQHGHHVLLVPHHGRGPHGTRRHP